MASGIVGVEPLEQPGTYRASLAGGGSMLVHGQPGQDLYERYKPKPAALGPEATADASSVMSTPGENMSRSDVPMGGPPPARDPAARSMAQELLGTGGGQTPGQALTGQTVPASAERRMPEQTERPQQSGPVSMGYAMKGLDPVTGKEVQGNAIRMPNGEIGIMLPGSKGTAGGLTSLGKSALENQAAAEVEAEKQRAIEAQAKQAGVDAAKAEADERAAYLDEAKIQNMLAAQQQQDEQAKIQEQVGQLQSKYDKARDDFMDSKVDPDEYMKRNGGAVGMFSALGVAMAQFGGAFTGQPNVAMQFVNNQIDRSIRAQEAQINVKGKAADNMLADLTREMGSLSAAKLSMRQLLTERSAIEMQQIGASTKSQQIQSLATETAAKAAGQAALLDQARKQGYLEHVMSSPLYYRQGRAGSAPRIALPTQESAGKMQESGLKVKEFELAKQKAEAEKATTANARTAVPTERTDKINAYAKGIVAANEIEQGVSELNGGAGDTWDNPTEGVLDRAKNVFSDKRKTTAAKLDADTNALARGIQASLGKSDNDAKIADEIAVGTGSGSDRVRAAADQRAKMIAGIRAEISTLPPSQGRQVMDSLPPEVKKAVLAQ